MYLRGALGIMPKRELVELLRGKAGLGVVGRNAHDVEARLAERPLSLSDDLRRRHIRGSSVLLALSKAELESAAWPSTAWGAETFILWTIPHRLPPTEDLPYLSTL